MKTIIAVPMTDINTSGEDGSTITPEKGDLVTVTTTGRFIEAKGDQGMVEIGPDEAERPKELLTESDMEKELQAMHERASEPDRDETMGGMMGS